MDLIIHNTQATWGSRTYPCAIGHGGIQETKQEGDGATPAGAFPLRMAYYRPDRLNPPETSLPLRALTPNDGWCDDPVDPLYNQFVTRPYAPSHELLWREDDLYNILLVVGYNDTPPIAGKGSAIFVHLARPGYPPTRGCVAFSLLDLLEILKGMNDKTRLIPTVPIT